LSCRIEAEDLFEGNKTESCEEEKENGLSMALEDLSRDVSPSHKLLTSVCFLHSQTVFSIHGTTQSGSVGTNTNDDNNY